MSIFHYFSCCASKQRSDVYEVKDYGVGLREGAGDVRGRGNGLELGPRRRLRPTRVTGSVNLCAFEQSACGFDVIDWVPEKNEKRNFGGGPRWRRWRKTCVFELVK